MNIIETKHTWNGTLAKRNSTKYIILHHRAGNGTVESIHAQHLSQGWTGIGYHFYVRKDGKVYRGRPIEMVGSHCQGQNIYSVGVCFEGNFETEKMSSAQIKAGQELISHLKEIYPNVEVKRHKDFGGTACPGKNFPFDNMLSFEREISGVADIIRSLGDRRIMTNQSLWFLKCYQDQNAYWLAYKIANFTKNIAIPQDRLKTVNDIVWELNYRGIMTDMKLWLRLLKEDVNLYWLAYKAANHTKNK